VTRDEAEARCALLAEESPDRETHRFVPRDSGNGTWSVAKVGLPPAGDDLATETRADEKPPAPGDPRSGVERDAGGPWLPGI